MKHTAVLFHTPTHGKNLQGDFKDVIGSTTADTTKVQQRYTELEKSPGGLRIQEELATVRK